MEAATLEVLMDVAAGYGGYVPTRAVRARGVPAARLVTLARRGSLERVGHGLYRLPGFPVDVHDDLLVAVLWSNERGAISHETALGFYELADVNPVAIDVTVPIAYRISRSGGEGYRVHHADLEERQVRIVDGVRIVDVATAIDGAIEQGVGDDLIRQAIAGARRLGWIRKQQASELDARRSTGG